MAARAFLDAFALRMAAILEHAEVVEVLARRNVAQRIGGADHRRCAGIEPVNALDEGVAKAALEQNGGQRGGRYRRELRACALTQGHGLSLRRQPCDARVKLSILVNSCIFLYICANKQERLSGGPHLRNLVSAVALAGFALILPAQAQDWPQRQVTIVVPFNA